MELPKSTEIFETELATIWLDENGIVCVLSKKHVAITKEKLDEVFRVIKQLANGQKICLVDEMTWIAPPNKAAREHATSEAKKYLKALALITKTPLSRMIGNILFSLNLISFPMKMFTGEQEAKEWLKQYL